MHNVLLIDNDDSFTINLRHLLEMVLQIECNLINYRELSSIVPNENDLTVISPGPGRPADYPDYSIFRGAEKPILGICLGMQILNDIYGGRTNHMEECIHGKAESIDFEGKKINVARYHSLGLDKLAENFEVIARTGTGIPMAIKHKSRPIVGYQFHPESFLTDKGEYFIKYALDIFTKS